VVLSGCSSPKAGEASAEAVEVASVPAPVVEVGEPVPVVEAGEPVKIPLHPLLAKAYSEVNFTDGVNEEEAETIADTYFDIYISGNGMANGVTDKGETWEVATFIDYDMRPWEPIQVDKKTGEMACKGYPSVSPR
jgi:hypothetical protein